MNCDKNNLGTTLRRLDQAHLLYLMKAVIGRSLARAPVV